MSPLQPLDFDAEGNLRDLSDEEEPRALAEAADSDVW
jgi:hypothetical protein